MRLKIFLATIAFLGCPGMALAQSTHSGHMGGMDHAAHVMDRPAAAMGLTEPGQGAFAALAEVVRVLEGDPNTDWEAVDLAGLRAHLVDMDRLVTDAVVTETPLPDGLSAIATGDAETLTSLRRMVPAHAAELARDGRWSVDVANLESGVELRVTSDDPAVVARIQGLGFFGLMASQNHHREHHLMIARGENAHTH